MASDIDFINDHFGVLKAANTRADLHARFEAEGGSDYNEFVRAAKSNADLASYFERQPENNASHPALFSLAEQAKLVKARGEAGAAQFLSDNGGALGSIKQRTKDSADTVKGAKNPWSKEYRGKDAEAERIRVIKSSTKLAAQLARAAGVTLSGQPLRGA